MTHEFSGFVSDEVGSIAGSSSEEGSVTFHQRKRSAMDSAKKYFEMRQK